MSREEPGAGSAGPGWASSPSAAPIFAEPWQARAFALMLRLREQGHFTATEWSAALGKELNDIDAPGGPAEASDYYQHWLAALESLVLAKGLTDRQALHQRKQAWAAAYRHTPHGKPVELG